MRPASPVSGGRTLPVAGFVLCLGRVCTARHSHTVSQTLVGTDGLGLHQPRSGAVEEIRAGDVVVTPADVWHWHGAAADHYMTHLSITESPGEGRPDAEWGEHVTDQEYSAR